MSYGLGRYSKGIMKNRQQKKKIGIDLKGEIKEFMGLISFKKNSVSSLTNSF